MPDDNGGIGVGGDGSVAWKVTAGHFRENSIVSRRVDGIGFLQSGVDETEPGLNFTIGIKVPKTGGEEFARALQGAADEAKKNAGQPGYRVKFHLVIEPRNEDQITVTWMSAPAPKGKYGASAKKAAPKKKAAAKKKATVKKGKR